jgi:subtilisin family serine protease
MQRLFLALFRTRRALALLLLLAAMSLGRLAAAPPPESGASPPATMAGELSSALATLPPGERLPVIVLFGVAPDLPSWRNQPRAARLEGVVRTLQGHAEASQGSLAPLLAQWEDQGRIQGVTSLWIINGLALSAEHGIILALAARPEVQRIVLDEQFAAPALLAEPAAVSQDEIEPNIALVNAPLLWELGYLGQGVVVANLDTGVDASHPDLAAQWRGGAHSWFDPYGQHPDAPLDLIGHGTASMGIMVGGSQGGSAIGMAPQAQWIAARIFDDRGYATTSAVHRAFQWLLDPDGDPSTPDAPHVVNNSWALGTNLCNLTFWPDIQALRAAGIAPVFAAGNAGPGMGTGLSPANNPGALAVGATDLADVIWQSSSRGPSACGEPLSLFPELAAPGVAIRTTDRHGAYQIATGTSLAAPHVAGALALLLSANPNLPLAHQEAALLRSAHDLGPLGPDDDYGAGRLDVAAAYDWLLERPRLYLPLTGRTNR